MQPKGTSAYLVQRREQERKLSPTSLLLLPPLLPIPVRLTLTAEAYSLLPEKRKISNLNANYLKEVKTMKKILSSAAISAVCLLAALPAQASPGGSSSNPLSGITDFLNQAQQSIQQYAQTIEEKVGAFGEEFQQIAEETAGDLGLIDPAEAREKAEAILDPNSATYNAGLAANLMDGQSARASASAILSDDGQSKQVEAYEGTQGSVEAVSQLAFTAQGDEVTQNVMKRIAQQGADTTQVLGAVRGDLLKLNEQTALSNVQLSNVSQTLDGETKRQNSQFTGAGYSNLRLAAQGKLF